MTIISSKAILSFDPKDYTNKHKTQSSWKKILLANLDGDFCEYYAWFIKKRFNLTLNTPLRKAHLTIVNDRSLDIKNWEKIKKEWEGKEIDISFDTDIRTNGEYWWLRADSNDARSLRSLLSLNPDPFFNFHITIGFPNEKNIDHSHYILKTIKYHDEYDLRARTEVFK